MPFVRFAQSAVLLLSLIGFALPAHAQNNKPIISGTFYEDRATTTNTNSSFILTFAQSPTNKFLNITNVACAIQVSSSQIITVMNIQIGTASGQTDLGRPYAIKGNATSETIGTTKFYSIVTNEVFYKMGPGRYPSIEFASITTSAFFHGVTCTIVGNLTDN